MISAYFVFGLQGSYTEHFDGEDWMAKDMTGCGGAMGRHEWMISALVDMASYAEENGLKDMHERLCHIVACAVTGDLARALAQPNLFSEVTNIVPFDPLRRQSRH